MHPYLPVLQATARAVAGLDLLLGFATLAEDHGYTRPTLVEGTELEIVGGRHPVIERCLPEGESYVANDVALDRDHQQILMITGPNMSGKSALLRANCAHRLHGANGVLCARAVGDEWGW